MNDPQMEAEANYFAFCLLMPEDLVRKELQKLKTTDLCDDRFIVALARKFAVPVGIMAIRLGQLGMAEV